MYLDKGQRACRFPRVLDVWSFSPTGAPPLLICPGLSPPCSQRAPGLRRGLRAGRPQKLASISLPALRIPVGLEGHLDIAWSLSFCLTEVRGKPRYPQNNVGVRKGKSTLPDPVSRPWRAVLVCSELPFPVLLPHAHASR